MTTLDDLLEDCDRLKRGVRIEDRRSDFGDLLRFESNLEEPIHRWFKFKEAFSSKLVSRLLAEYANFKKASLSVLDPFCGVGTSLLAAHDTAQDHGVRTVLLRGIEVNPYMRFVATTKLRWPEYNPAYMMRAAAIVTNGLSLSKRPALPDLSTMRNSKYVSARDLRRLLELRDKVRLIAKNRPERRPLLLGLAAAAESVFNLRKDGRALRFRPRDPGETVDTAVSRCWGDIAEDLQHSRTKSAIDCQIHQGDGRRADTLLRGQRFDLILFSPPYLNNIDYTEVYKIELWLLGFLTSRAQMVAQRRRTFRSHPSCLFPEYDDATTNEVRTILGAPFKRLLVYASHDETWRNRLFSGYFADMLRTLRAAYRLLGANGRVLIVIGNSVHGQGEHQIPVATDLWTCKLAGAAGLKVDEVLIGRQLGRRRLGSAVLRESILVMSKA